MRQLKIVKQITNRNQDSLDRYFHEISKEGLISAEEEVLLAQKIKMGDKEALEKLVKANLRFVVSVAKQYQNQGLSLPDLINEGNLGLIKAAEKFDDTKGFKFISYAVWWIRQFILQALAQQSRIVRLPINKIGSINKINRTTNKLEQEYEYEPSAEEIAEILDISEYEVNLTLGLGGKHLSIDAPFNADDNDGLLDVLVDSSIPNTDKSLMIDSLKTEIQRVLSTINVRENEVVCKFYGIGCRQMSLVEIGESMGITRERARQIKEKAIRRLRLSSRNNLLRNYLG